ncbi:MAG TPA: hypothetical protein VK155_01670, partial [Bacteroidales bacterium]|nr:hypothetical protein [Bacteroidales bacterium]
MVLMLLMMASIQVNAQIYGVAPVQQPTGGFAVDGDGFADFTEPGIGDWFDTTLYTGTGGTVFNMTTNNPYDLNYPLISIHYNDYWGNGEDPTAFTSSTKIHHPYDETFTWGPGQVLAKNEISNATLLFTRGDPSIDPDGPAPAGDLGDLWCIFAADRQVNNGDAYIDFEFLQNSLFQIPYTDDPSSGYFQGNGPHGTRTIGDILVTIRFENGGTNAIPIVHKWVQIGIDNNGPVYGWELYEQNLWPAYSLFMSSNQSETDAPWNPFGQPTYLPNQFAEGAINLSEFIPGIGFDECNYLATIFVRTKTSQSTTAELKDFPGAPYQLNLTPSLVCPEPVEVPACSTMEEISAAYLAWRAGFSYSGGIDPVTDNLDELPATFTDLLALPEVEITACGGSYTFTLEVDDYCLEVPETCESTFTILSSDILVTCPEPVSLPACTSLADIQSAYDTWAAGFTVTGGCEPTSNIDEIPTLPTDVDCLGASLSFTLLAENGEGYCEDEESCGSTFVVEDVEDFTMPADDGEIIACASELYTPTPPTVYDNCNELITPSGPVVSGTPECEGNVTYVWNYADCEGNNHDWTYTFTIEYEDFDMPADDGETIACASELYTPTPPTVYDNCNELITPSGPVVSGTPECEGNVTYVWNYADC